MKLNRIFQKFVAICRFGLLRLSALTDSVWTFKGALSKEADEFLTISNIEFNQKQKLLHEEYIQNSKRYDMDLEKGKLVLTYEDHKTIFDAKFIGSSRTSDNSWEWGWSNPNVPKSLIVSESEIKSIGEKYKLRYLLKGAVKIPNRYFSSYLSGIALKIENGAIGVYNAEGNGVTYHFLLFNPELQKT